ncbi:sulfite exporter TauE/SafE family protein [Litoreibacter halocynthiae]|uniref:sulfite exporter TauE/SafE family protein n=1 Tax=Litoreibacter halocynthiae TaxID=1242689 RepID=UPI0024900859|nr:sulfite exporter TauE/SafE family protein [Litoreibacter halocynthiae]
MLDFLAPALAQPGLGWVTCITVIAGIVYGFAGFGAALIFMPVATIFWVPELAVASFSVSALASLVTLVPRAWPQMDRSSVLTMIAFSVLGAPIGIYLLRTSDVTHIRWAVLVVAAITLAALMSGWRQKLSSLRSTQAGIGVATGFIGGATGLLGPVMLLFQLSGSEPVARVRANSLVFLTISSLLLLPSMALQGILTTEAIILGVILLIPYGIGAKLGQAIFIPRFEVFYRNIAYAIIAAAILMGLPLWD